MSSRCEHASAHAIGDETPHAIVVVFVFVPGNAMASIHLVHKDVWYIYINIPMYLRTGVATRYAYLCSRIGKYKKKSHRINLNSLVRL